MEPSQICREEPSPEPRASNPSGSAPSVFDCAPEDRLILSLLPRVGDVHGFPGSPILELTPEDLPFTSHCWLPLAAVRKLRTRRHRVVVVARNQWRLKLLALTARSDRHGLVTECGVEPFGLRDIAVHAAFDFWHGLRRAARRAWLKAQIPSPVGPGNDYAFIARRVRRAGPRYEPRLVASVIVPVYNRRTVLEKTLAGLALQTYPRELFEVIVADDGSSDHPEEIAARFEPALDIRTVRQEDDGYRLAAVRNLGIRAARGDVVVSLDGDMLPEPGWLAAHMRWFHAHDGPLLTIGLRRDVDTSEISADRILSGFDVVRRLPRRPVASAGAGPPRSPEDWRLPELERTRWMRDHPAPYRLASGGNVAFRKRDAEAAGLYDEAFRSWGREDNELAYRLYRRGAYLIPDALAFAYHQTHPVSPDRDAHLEASTRILERKVPFYRGYSPGRAWDVPKVSVYMPAHDAGAFIRQAVESALAQTMTDLEVCICNDGSTDATAEVLARHFSDHPRVRWVSQAHGGVGSASMRALSLCRGEYILQLDADDELLPRAAEVLAGELDRHPGASLACGGYRTCDAAGNEGKEEIPVPYSVLEHLVGMVIYHPRMFRARDFFRTAGFVGAAAVDYDISLKLAERGEVRVVREVLYRYRKHGGNLSIQSAALQLECRTRAIRDAFARRGLDWDVLAPDPKRPHRLEIAAPPASIATVLGIARRALESRRTDRGF